MIRHPWIVGGRICARLIPIIPKGHSGPLDHNGVYADGTQFRDVWHGDPALMPDYEYRHIGRLDQNGVPMRLYAAAHARGQTIDEYVSSLSMQPLSCPLP